MRKDVHIQNNQFQVPVMQAFQIKTLNQWYV